MVRAKSPFRTKIEAKIPEVEAKEEALPEDDIGDVPEDPDQDQEEED